RMLARFVSREEHEIDVPAPSVGPEGEVDAGELREHVRAAVARLSEKHRAVVVLRMFQDCSTRDAARILGVPEGTVLSRLSRAMRDLEQHLAPYVRHGARVDVPERAL